MGNKIIYNGQEYAGSVVNDNSVGEFTSNSGEKNPTGSNNERFNDYQNNTISNGTYMTVTGSNNTANSCNNSILTGNGNVSGTTNNSLVVGTGNTTANINNSLIGGQNSVLTGNEGNGNVITGNGIKVQGSSIKHNIINGYANSTDSFKIDGIVTGNYINGFDNIIQGNILNNIIVGSGNTAASPAYSLVIGQSNTLTGNNTSWCNSIIGNDNVMSQLDGYQNAASHGMPQHSKIIGDNNFVTGSKNIVIGDNQCVIGQRNTTIGWSGNGTPGTDEYSVELKSSDRASFLDTYYPASVPVESANSGIIEGSYCYKEGFCTIIGYNPGNDFNQGLPLYVHMEGFENVSIGSYNHIEGWGNLGNCADSHIEGRNNVIADTTTGLQDSETIDDPGTTSKAGYPYNTQNHLEGLQNKVLHAMASHIEGSSNKAVITSYNHIEGYANTSLRDYNSHIEGSQNVATNTTTTLHIEGTSNKANGGITCSHIEGNNNTVRSGINYVHVEGCDNVVDNQSHISHAEGDHNIIGGSSAVGHIEGQNNTINQGSYVIHIEGRNNITSSNSMYAHAEGWGTQIQGRGSHAQNVFTAAKSNGQTAIGIANIADTANTYALIVGNGSYTATSLYQYSESSTYNTDDEVIYNGKVYKCLEDGVTGEWDSTKWDLEATEIIDGQEITRSNAMTVSWDGVLNVNGVNADIQINGNSIATGGDIANPNISDAYNNSSTYSIGDYCIYNNILYKCNTSISVAENFDSSKWTRVTTGEELLTIIDRMDTAENDIDALEPINYFAPVNKNISGEALYRSVTNGSLINGALNSTGLSLVGRQEYGAYYEYDSTKPKYKQLVVADVWETNRLALKSGIQYWIGGVSAPDDMVVVCYDENDDVLRYYNTNNSGLYTTADDPDGATGTYKFMVQADTAYVRAIFPWETSASPCFVPKGWITYKGDTNAGTLSALPAVDYNIVGMDGRYLANMFDNIYHMVGAELYNPTKAYNAGDYMFLGFTLFRAENNVPAGSYYLTNFEEVNIMTLIHGLATQLNGFTIHDVMTQAQYDALGTYDAHTIYPIVG